VGASKEGGEGASGEGRYQARLLEGCGIARLAPLRIKMGHLRRRREVEETGWGGLPAEDNTRPVCQQRPPKSQPVAYD